MLTGLRIGCISTSSWHGLWTRKQWIMNQLAERNEILFIDPQESITYRARWGGRRRQTGSSEPVPRGITHLEPWSVLPMGRHWRIAHRFNMALLMRQIAIQERFRAPDLWWIYDPAAVPVVEKFRARVLIYDCVDRHSAYGGYRGLLDRLEQRLLRQADLVFVTARGLVEYCSACSNDVHYLPNGFDADLFNQNIKIPRILEIIPSPRLGFVGGIGHWLDLDLIVHAARHRPDWSFVFVGPPGDRAGCLPDLPNIHALGRCHRSQIPGFIRGFDVGLIPFRRTRLTETVNPLKAYEYLAGGIPVVSTFMPELDDIGMVRQAIDRDAFMSAVEESLAEGNDETPIAQRKSAVAHYSQQNILDSMSSLIQEKLGRTAGD